MKRSVIAGLLALIISVPAVADTVTVTYHSIFGLGDFGFAPPSLSPNLGSDGLPVISGGDGFLTTNAAHEWLVFSSLVEPAYVPTPVTVITETDSNLFVQAFPFSQNAYPGQWITAEAAITFTSPSATFGFFDVLSSGWTATYLNGHFISAGGGLHIGEDTIAGTNTLDVFWDGNVQEGQPTFDVSIPVFSAPAAPKSETWVMVAVGFSILGWFRRRRTVSSDT